MMILKKIFCIILLASFGLVGMTPKVVAQTQVEESLSMSAAKYLQSRGKGTEAEQMGLNIAKYGEKTLIICGMTACEEETKCAVKITTKTTGWTKAHNALTYGVSTGGSMLPAMGSLAGAAAASAATGGASLVVYAVAYGAGAALRGIHGNGQVSEYEFECISDGKLPEGYQWAPEGGLNRKVKIQTGRWFGKDKTTEDFKCLNGTNSKNEQKQYCLKSINNTYIVEHGDDSTIQSGCEVLPVKLHNARRCFFCPLVQVVFNTAAYMPKVSFAKLGSAFATLLALGMAIWIAFQTLTHVSSLTKQDGPKFLGGLIKQSYKFLLAFLLLQNSAWIFENGVEPILEAGITFGDTILPARIRSSTDWVAITNKYQQRDAKDHNAETDSVDEEVNYGDTLDRTAEVKEKLKEVGGADYLSSSLYARIDVYITNVQHELAIMQAIGTSLTCAGWNGMVKKNETSLWQGIKMAVQGIIMAGFSFLLILAFTFYMLDAVVQIGVAGGLAPFLIASWPFKITSQYASTGIKMVLNSAFIFLFLGMVISINIGLIDSAIMNRGSEENKEILQLCTEDECTEEGCYYNLHREQCDKVKQESRNRGLVEIAEAFNANDENKLLQLTDISGIDFLILIFCCIFGFKFINQISSLAGQFASGAMKPIAPSIATMAGSAGWSAAKKLTKSSREAIGQSVEDLGKGALGAVFHPIDTVKNWGRKGSNLYNNARNKLNGLHNRFSGGGGGNGGRSNNTGGDPDENNPDNVNGGDVEGDNIEGGSKTATIFSTSGNAKSKAAKPKSSGEAQAAPEGGKGGGGVTPVAPEKQPKPQEEKAEAAAEEVPDAKTDAPLEDGEEPEANAAVGTRKSQKASKPESGNARRKSYGKKPNKR